MERSRSRIIVDAQKQLSEAQQKTEATLLSAGENYQRYFARLLKIIKSSSSSPDTYIHVGGTGSKTPEMIVINDVELWDLEIYNFDTFPTRAVSGGFWGEREVTITIGESGLDLIDEGVVPRKRLEARLLPEPRIIFKASGPYTKVVQVLLGSSDHPTKAQAFFELLSAVDSVIRHRLTEAQAQKSASATP